MHSEYLYICEMNISTSTISQSIRREKSTEFENFDFFSNVCWLICRFLKRRCRAFALIPIPKMNHGKQKRREFPAYPLTVAFRLRQRAQLILLALMGPAELMTLIREMAVSRVPVAAEDAGEVRPQQFFHDIARSRTPHHKQSAIGREKADKLRLVEQARETAMQVLRNIPESNLAQVVRWCRFAQPPATC